MSKIIIQANPQDQRVVENANPNSIIHVAEMFTDTIQGEGVSIGVPAVFLRVQHCTQSCTWCDTQAVWRQGNPYTIDEILDLFVQNGVVEKLQDGMHLVLTGGSPLKQQESLMRLLNEFYIRFHFLPYIEVENEANLEPHPVFAQIVSQWNNSPKLSSNGMDRSIRHHPEAIKAVAMMSNSWFKFVVEKEEDWDEIEKDFLVPGLISEGQIILMPRGESQAELAQTRSIAVDMAIKHNVRFSDRLHITVWNKKVSV